MIPITNRLCPVLHVGADESFSVHATSEPMSHEDMSVNGSTYDTEITVMDVSNEYPTMTDTDDDVPYPVNWDALLGIDTTITPAIRDDETHSTTDAFASVIDTRRPSSTAKSLITKFNQLCRLLSIVFQYIRTSSLACVSITSYIQPHSNGVLRSSHSTRRGCTKDAISIP